MSDWTSVSSVQTFDFKSDVPQNETSDPKSDIEAPPLVVRPFESVD